jgi:hypothetical protein
VLSAGFFVDSLLFYSNYYLKEQGIMCMMNYHAMQGQNDAIPADKH